MTKGKKIYVIAPARAVTGGPELLHQLVDVLHRNSFDSYIYYLPNISNPKPKEYEIYRTPIADHIQDIENNVIVVPEVFPLIKFIQSFEKITKVIWWLSVDNFVKSFLTNEHSLKNFVKLIWKIKLVDPEEFVEKYIISHENKLKNLVEQLKPDYHFVQSYYAYDFLRRLGIKEEKIFYLSDYISDAFLHIEWRDYINYKENIVLYNPKKGLRHTKKIIKLGKRKGIKFLPLAGMTRDELIKTMMKAKVYIDFGNHPGKDRMPREAALAGCCVITGKRGSAANSKDVPIPEYYKISEKERDFPRKVIDVIIKCFEEYSTRTADFEIYRDRIKNEKKEFIKNALEIFSKLLQIK